jgi:hypothetical protein
MEAEPHAFVVAVILLIHLAEAVEDNLLLPGVDADAAVFDGNFASAFRHSGA